MTHSLAELCICAAAEAFRGEGETMITSIGLVPRLAASLAKSTFAPGLMMTEGEAYLVSEPVPVGPRGDYRPKIEGLMTYERVFDIIYRGMRHAMVTPVQVDTYGQMNISVIGDYARPKAALLGVRGYPGNTVNNRNSMFVPSHDTRTFVAGEVDMVAGAGYNPARWPGGRKPEFLDLRRIVLQPRGDGFSGPHQCHPGNQPASGRHLRGGAGQHGLCARTHRGPGRNGGAHHRTARRAETARPA